jgi:hypothetical protein
MPAPKIIHNTPDTFANRPKPTRAPACGTATGLTIDRESKVVRFPIDQQAQALSRQASRVARRSFALLRQAQSLSDAITMRQEGRECPKNEFASRFNPSATRGAT